MSDASCPICHGHQKVISIQRDGATYKFWQHSEGRPKALGTARNRDGQNPRTEAIRLNRMIAQD
jgi:hypothetical protein